MKKWNKPQIVDLRVENTNESKCPEDVNAKTPWGLLCDKKKPNGDKAYTPTIAFGVCKYHLEGGWCNYKGESSIS